MPFAYKVLGQSNPAAATPTTLYTVPGGTEAIGSSLVVCNQGVSTVVRVAVRPAGAVLAAEHYIVYDLTLNGNDTLPLVLGLSLEATDVVTVYAGTATVSFSLFGAEQ